MACPAGDCGRQPALTPPPNRQTLPGNDSQGSGHQPLAIHEAFPQHSEAQIGAGLGANPARDNHRSGKT